MRSSVPLSLHKGAGVRELDATAGQDRLAVAGLYVSEAVGQPLCRLRLARQHRVSSIYRYVGRRHPPLPADQRPASACLARGEAGGGRGAEAGRARGVAGTLGVPRGEIPETGVVQVECDRHGHCQDACRRHGRRALCRPQHPADRNVGEDQRRRDGILSVDGRPDQEGRLLRPLEGEAVWLRRGAAAREADG